MLCLLVVGIEFVATLGDAGVDVSALCVGLGTVSDDAAGSCHGIASADVLLGRFFPVDYLVVAEQQRSTEQQSADQLECVGGGHGITPGRSC